MRVLVFPRDDQNPYQSLLYGETERFGIRVSYLGRLTPSCTLTLTLTLLPLETAPRGATGPRFVYLHRVFGFTLPAAEGLPRMRRLAQAWFTFWLRTTRLLGVPVVWTAHNVLPYVPVIADDVASQWMLVATSDLVIAHCHSALADLAALGAVPQECGHSAWPTGPGAPLRLVARARYWQRTAQYPVLRKDPGVQGSRVSDRCVHGSDRRPCCSPYRGRSMRGANAREALRGIAGNG
jgi:hypothetical protein